MEAEGFLHPRKDPIVSNVIPITDHRGEPRVDTRLLADRLELQHASVFKLVQGYESDFAEFGKVRFEIGPTASGQQQRYALLNEDQSYLLLTFSRNTPTVRELKVALVKAFRAARVAREAVETDYLTVLGSPARGESQAGTQARQGDQANRTPQNREGQGQQGCDGRPGEVRARTPQIHVRPRTQLVAKRNGCARRRTLFLVEKFNSFISRSPACRYKICHRY